MYRHLLVPLDGSELSSSLVSQAVEFARALKARITFFTAREDVGGSGDGALLRTLSPEDFAAAAAGEANAILAKALVAARVVGLDCEAVARTGARPYELILSVAAERGCDLIFMASHGHRGLRGLMLGSQTQKVLAHSSLPVLVASVESNVANDAARAAIDIIKDEHRAIAAVVNGLRRQAGRLKGGAAGAPDLDFVAALLHYLRAFPDVLHHPKEERHLFSRLARRDGELDALIATLEREHRDGGAQLAAIDALLADGRQDAARQGELGVAIERFADAQWQHISTEEKLILPAARRLLGDEDWRAIEDAFRQNGDCRVGSEQDLAFRQLFVRLMNDEAGGATP
ncbi:universal stress protein [Zoogloea sp.]|uniref:universal stress protein n=1 Tax=Zoogloea sp. TaxID=49181 RepID=UPI0035B118E1